MNLIPMNKTHELTLTDRFDRIRQKAQQTAEIWQPEPGECLIGELAGVQKAVGQYGENYQVLIKDERGHVTAAWLTPWLRDNLSAQGAERGDLVAITFMGKKQSPAGRIYNAYGLVVDKADCKP